jgi:hypothetical protein
MSKKSLARPRSLIAMAAGLVITALLAGSAMSQAPAAAPAPLLELRLALADDTINPVTDSVLRLADTLGTTRRTASTSR